MKSEVSSGSTHANSNDNPTMPLAEEIKHLSKYDALRWAIVDYIKERQLDNPENATRIQKELALLTGQPEQRVALAFKGRANELCINFLAAGGPSEFHAYLIEKQKEVIRKKIYDERYIYSLRTGIGILAFSWMTASQMINGFNINSEEGLSTVLMGVCLSGLAALRIFENIELKNPKTTPDTRVPEYRERVSKFIQQFANTAIPSNPGTAAIKCGYCGTHFEKATGSCSSCGAARSAAVAAEDRPALVA